MAKKSMQEKYETANKKGGIKKHTDKGFMYISTPKEIGEIIKKVPKGKLITTKQIADKLAQKHGVDFTCPLTTGIFVSVNAGLIEEYLESGKREDEVSPYWRAVKEKGLLYDKYLGMKSRQSDYLSREGFTIEKKGKKNLAVKDFEKYLVK